MKLYLKNYKSYLYHYQSILLSYILVFSLVFASCNNSSKVMKLEHRNHKDKKHVHQHNVDHHKEDHHKNHQSNHKQGNEVNQHMHNTSVEELIQRFESPERDAYQKPEKVLDYIGNIKGQDILDIGAGSGYFSVKMVNRGAHVIAGDVDDEFLAYMRQRMVEEKITPSQMELRKLPYDSPALKPREIDKAIIVNTYHHIENRVAYFDLVRKGLRKDGELIVVDFLKKELPIGPGVNHKFSVDEVKAELLKAGFNAFEVNTSLLEMQYIVKAKE